MKRKVQDNWYFKEVVPLFIQYQEIKGLSPKTVDMDKEAITNFLKKNGLTYEDKLSIVNEEFFSHFVKRLSDEDISISTKNICISHIRVFLYWCMGNGYIKPFKINLLKGQKSTMKFFTEEEVKKLIEPPSKNCSFIEDRTYTIICFILSTGARANTLLNLKIEDLDFKNRTITYTHLKNKSTAIVPMSNSLYKVLSKYLSNWERKDVGYLFCNKSENQLTLTALETSIRRYCDKRGVKPRGPHRLRHSFARMYIISGGDAFTLKRILTHSTMNMTSKYVELFSSDLNNHINNFSPLDNLKGNSSTIKRRNNNV